MKKNLVPILIVVVLAIIVGMMYASITNKEVRLRSEIKAQEQVREAYYDKLWKIISQKAQVAEKYKEGFKEIYGSIMEGRYGSEGEGTLMKWIVESNPEFDSSIYKDLIASIEAERTGFFFEQKKLIDLANEHNILLNSFPSSLIVGDRPPIEIMIISSTKSKQVMETGVEDNVEVF